MMKRKSWFSLVELAVAILIMAILAGVAGIVGYNIWKNSLDTKIITDLKTLKDATQLYMVDTNGVTPCFTPESSEGGTANWICQHSGYNYVQGQTVKSIDFDEITEEVFTFENILAPKYLERVNDSALRGEYYVYTTGKYSTNQGAGSFAYSSRLNGTKAEDILGTNFSVINALMPTETLKGCTAANVNYSTTKLTPESGKTNVSKPRNYYSIEYLTWVEALIKDANKCDLFSDGIGIDGNNFTAEQNTGSDKSVSISVNAAR